MPSAGKGESPFDILLAEVQSLINSTPDRYHQCAQGLRDVEANIVAEYQHVTADTKAHPDHKASNDAVLHRLSITLAMAVTRYAGCIRTAALKPA